MKAHASIRDSVWKCAGWYFYIDKFGDVHTSRRHPWDPKFAVSGDNNHWLRNDGYSIGPEGECISRPCLENK